jgi:enolase
MDVQECMVVPRQTKFSERLRAGAEIFHALKGLLAKKGLATTVGDEGGFAPALAKAEDSFDLLLLAIRKAGYRAGKDVVLAADVAASEMYDKKKKAYAFKAEGRSYTASQLLERYRAWQSDYPFFSIEDPFAEDDWAAWSAAVRAIGKKTWFVGDDLFVTNPERLAIGIEKKAATALLVKPNQIGTLSETVDAILLAQSHGMRTIISHRSGETSDTTVADLAVASGSEGIKTGSLSRSERIEKYNRLLAIERELAD